MPPVLIKKYGNRRLYDTGDSKYITLDELATRIRTGTDVRVVDAQTNEDLTQVTLTQLILEEGSAAKFLPVQLLFQMIRLSDDALAEFFSRYVTSALDMYLQAKRGMRQLYNPMEAMTRMWTAPFSGMYAPPSPQQRGPIIDDEPPYVAPPPPPEVPPNDMAEMRRELDELKQALRDGLAARTEAPAPRARPAPKKKRS